VTRDAELSARADRCVTTLGPGHDAGTESALATAVARFSSARRGKGAGGDREAALRLISDVERALGLATGERAGAERPKHATPAGEVVPIAVLVCL
jgi:hypothetical protein